ncbi:MAG: DUF1858 domain-containing protein [Candidatus Pacearchaeota archaeon]
MRKKRKRVSRKKKAKVKQKLQKHSKLKLEISKATKISELVERYPALIDFFVEKQHFCTFCPMAAVESLGDFCKANGIDFRKLKKQMEDFLKKKA